MEDNITKSIHALRHPSATHKFALKERLNYEIGEINMKTLNYCIQQLSLKYRCLETLISC